jgi:hypothetical protein
MYNAANVIDELRMNKKEFEDEKMENKYDLIVKSFQGACKNISDIMITMSDVIKKLVEECKTSQEENKRLKNSAEFSCISDDIPPIGGIHDVDNYDDLPPIGGFHD